MDVLEGGEERVLLRCQWFRRGLFVHASVNAGEVFAEESIEIEKDEPGDALDLVALDIDLILAGSIGWRHWRGGKFVQLVLRPRRLGNQRLPSLCDFFSEQNFACGLNRHAGLRAIGADRPAEICLALAYWNQSRQEPALPQIVLLEIH